MVLSSRFLFSLKNFSGHSNVNMALVKIWPVECIINFPSVE